MRCRWIAWRARQGLLHRDPDDVVSELCSAIFCDPADGSWQRSDAYLSGPVRDKLKAVEAAAAFDSTHECNVIRGFQTENGSPQTTIQSLIFCQFPLPSG